MQGQEPWPSCQDHSLGHPGQRPQKQQTEQTHVPGPHQPWQHQSYPEAPALHCRPVQALSKVSILVSGVKPGTVEHPCHHPERMRQEDWGSSPGYNERPYLNKLKTEPAEESGELKPKDSGKQPGSFLEGKALTSLELTPQTHF